MRSAGIHHITAIAGDPQQNLDFYTEVLGLRVHAGANGFWSDNNLRTTRRRGALILAQILATAALLAKITAVVFVPAALLLCWWKHAKGIATCAGWSLA